MSIAHPSKLDALLAPKPTLIYLAPRQMGLWLGISLLFAATYALLALQQAFSSEYVVQDDARQHVFWMARFVDPNLFPQDLIADYFQSISPVGYNAVYRGMAAIGVDPLVLNKCLPLVLTLLTTIYCYLLTLQFLPIPVTAWLATVLLNQNLWSQDGLISATSRAFLYPIFFAFLYYLVRDTPACDPAKQPVAAQVYRWLPCGIAIVLLGLVYPSYALVAGGLLVVRLWDWRHWPPVFLQHRPHLILTGLGLAAIVLVLLPQVLTDSPFGPMITRAEAEALPEFWLKGRNAFFSQDAWFFWFNGTRSGVMLAAALVPPLTYSGFLLPIFLALPRAFPLAKQITGKTIVLVQMVGVGLGLFFAAHVMLFTLYLPSRYTQHTLRITLAIAAAIVLTLVIDSLWRWANVSLTRFWWAGAPAYPDIPHFTLTRLTYQREEILKLRRWVVLAITTGLVVVLISFPRTLDKFPWTNYMVGRATNLYSFLAAQPPATLTAALGEEANNLPVFTQRPVLLAREYGIAYHMGYYRQFRQRVIDLINAQYSPNLAEIQAFIQHYGIDFWLVDKNAFTPDYIARNYWLRQFKPAASQARERLERGEPLALPPHLDRCRVLETDSLILLNAPCLENDK
ncbi:hypothetical protein [Trichothermofontia sp.]